MERVTPFKIFAPSVDNLDEIFHSGSADVKQISLLS